MRPLNLASLLLLLPAASAQSRVQLSLAGAIERTGGARVEIGLVFGEPGAEPRTGGLALHLAEGTSAGEVTALLAHLLDRGGARVLGAPTADPKPRASLFVDHVRSVRVRAGHGLQTTITLGDDAPETIRLLTPEVRPDGALVTLGATKLRTHDGTAGRIDIELEIDPRSTPARIAEQLSTRAIGAGWEAERSGGDGWRLVPSIEGARLSGCAIALSSSGDWGLEVALPVRR